MRRFGFILSWVAVAAGATGLAWGVLDAADRQVGDAPATPVLVVDEIVDADSRDPLTTDSTTPARSSGDSVGPGSSTSSSSTVASPTTTSTPTTSTTTSITSSSFTTSTVATPVVWDATTVPSGGGVVVVGHRPGEVRLDSASPAAGYSMEIDKDGPDEVRVEFESDADRFEIRVRWIDGALSVDVDGP